MLKKCFKYKHSLTVCILINIICIFLLMSLTFVVYANHDCQKENCPICEELQGIQTSLKKLGSHAVFAILFFSLLPFLLEEYVINKFKYIVFETPIRLKVRLNH